MSFDIVDDDFRFKYHHPLPNFYRFSNPINPKHTIKKDILDDLTSLAIENDCVGTSHSKLSDDFKKEWNIDFNNVIIFKYEISSEILEMEPSKLKCKLTDDEFQKIGRRVYSFADFLLKNDYKKEIKRIKETYK